MTEHSDGRVTALADAFKAGWHAADDAGLSDRTHHGIRAVLDSAEFADLVAYAVHEALERAAEAVRLSAYPPRYILGIDPDAGVIPKLDGLMLMLPDDAIPPRRLCDPHADDTEETR